MTIRTLLTFAFFCGLHHFLPYSALNAQKVLGFQEFMNYVATYHPVAKTANLQLQNAKLLLQQARSNFDPTLNYQNKIKTFNKKNYYFNQLADLTVPLWWNVDLKAAWERNIGSKLDPENYTSSEGLFSIGIALPITQSLLIDARRNAIQIAKAMGKMADADRLLLLNDLFLDAASAYLDWALAYQQNQQFQSILAIASKRKMLILSRYENGFASELDTLDAFNNLLNRQIEARENEILLTKAKLAVSNFLWAEDLTPLEIGDSLVPQPLDSLALPLLENSLAWIEQHPAILKYQAKAQQLELERKLKISKLLPKTVAEYNLLSYPSEINQWDYHAFYQSYKAGLKFSFPLFLRKERADLGFTKLKIQENTFSLALKRIELQNKFLASYNNFLQYQAQLMDIQQYVKNYQRLYDGEYQRFEIGESNVLNLIIRENTLLNNQLKLSATWQKYLKSRLTALWVSARLVTAYLK